LIFDFRFSIFDFLTIFSTMMLPTPTPKYLSLNNQKANRSNRR